jgi:hypothetical protein
MKTVLDEAFVEGFAAVLAVEHDVPGIEDSPRVAGPIP